MKCDCGRTKNVTTFINKETGEILNICKICWDDKIKKGIKNRESCEIDKIPHIKHTTYHVLTKDDYEILSRWMT
jgi:hypothetical protein